MLSFTLKSQESNHPIFTEMIQGHYSKHNQAIEIWAPGDQPVNLSNYMIVMHPNNASANNIEEMITWQWDDWSKRYRKYVPGYDYAAANQTEFDSNPGIIVPDSQVDSMLQPDDAFVLARAWSWDNSENEKIAAKADIVWARHTVNTPGKLLLNEGEKEYDNDLGIVPWFSWPPESVFALFKIMNDSVKNGKKALAKDPSDYKLIDIFGYINNSDQWSPTGVPLTAEEGHGYRRKEIYKKGDTLQGVEGSWGNSESESEWIYQQLINDDALIADLGSHNFGQQEPDSAVDINITDFGAVADDGNLDTDAIQAAIDACGSGDRVVVPAGTFMTGTIYLKSNMTLKLSEGAILKGSDDWEDYLHKNGNWNNNNAMIIAEFGSANITIEGPGIIDGNNCTNPNGRLGYRGQMCMTIYQNASNIRISDITIQNFTSWNIYVKEGAQGVTLENVTILGGADGFHIVYGTDITVTNCDFRNGDDNIAGLSNVNVTILNTRFNSATNGMRFSGKNVTVRDCEFRGPAEYPLRRSADDVPPTKYSMDAAIWHYSPGTRPDFIPSDNWVVENCTVDSVGQVLRYFYDESKSAKNKGIKTMTFNNLTANTYYPDGAFYVDDILSEEKVRGEMRLIINGGDISSSSTSNAVINMKNFDHLELHDVTLRNNGEMPAIEAINGDTVWLDNVAIDPVSNPNPFNLYEITTVIEENSGNAFNTGIETSDEDLGGWNQGIATYKGYVFFHRFFIANGRKQCYLVGIDPNNSITISDVLYTVSEESHSHGGDLMVDGSGRVHVIFGAFPGHENSDGLHHLVSDIPLSVTSGYSKGQGFPDGITGTYRDYDRAPNGDLYAFIKNKNSTQNSGEGELWHWNNSESTWNKIEVVNSESGKTTYSPQLEIDNDGRVHLSWIWGNGPTNSPHRHVGSYALYNPSTGKFYKADGSEYANLPITSSTADAFQPLEKEWDEREINGASMRLDGENRPVISCSYVGMQKRIIRWNGNEWKRTITNARQVDGILAVHGSAIYLHEDEDIHVSNDWGDSWDTQEIASGLSAAAVVKADSSGDVVLYYKDKSGARKNIYTGYIKYGENPTLHSYPPKPDLDSFDVELHFAIANEETLLPEELEVILNGRKFYTDSSGKIKVSDILQGYYTINLPGEEYQIAKNKNIEIRSDSIFTIQLIPLKQLHVEVLDRNDFGPVYRAAVNINGKTLLTGEDGMIDFGKISGDTTLVFSITHEDYLTYNDSAFVNSDTTIQITMYPKLTDIGFKISDSDGPVYSAMVNIGGMTGYTDNNGEVLFYKMPAGKEYHYKISKDERKPIEDSLYLQMDTTVMIMMSSDTLNLISHPSDGSANGIRIYPNPFNKSLNIKTPYHNVHVKIMDINGRLLIHKQLENGIGTLKVNHLLPGHYILKITDDDGKVTNYPLIK